MKKVWQRYFLVEFLKIFTLIITTLYFIYVLVDYAAHAKMFRHEHAFFWNVALYYLCQFAQWAEIFIPIALMIATIKVLTTSNLRLESVALAAGGISLKKITYPFLWAALFCAALLYLNFQFLQPLSLSQIAAYEELFNDREKTVESKKVNALVLEDNTLLIYQKYDPEKRAFFDAFWLKNCDQFFRIQFLFPYEKNPVGKFVDSLKRNKEGEIVKLASYEEISFPEMRFDKKSLFSAVVSPRMQSISQLAHSLRWKQNHFGLDKMNDREAEAATMFYFKLTLPLVCLFAVIGPAPFCLQFTRHLRVFLIFGLSLFGIISFFALVNSSVILGESQVIAPMLAILMPQMAFLFLLGWKYAKL